jgi:nucleoside 2-deoxyribosyltransferase
MPFSEQETGLRPDGFFKEVYISIIKPACEKAGFDAVTADRKGSDVIHTTILREILEADIVLADLTDHNPNVMFELGLRMAAGKPTSLIKTKDTGRIFDVDNVLRVYEYSENLWKSTVELDVPLLAEHITATWEARDTGSSYVEILTGKSGG